MAAGGDCLVDQLRCAALRVGYASHDGFDLLVLDHGRQAVGAYEQAVAGFDVYLVHIGARVGVGPERARDDGALRMMARFLGGELAGFDHVGHKAVVARKLLQLAVMQQIGARVADLRDDEALVFQHAGGKGGAHALTAAPIARRADDLVVRFFHGVLQGCAVEVLRGQLSQHVHRYLGSDLACGVTAHAVGDGEQRRSHHQAVLVVVAHAADVGSASERGDSASARALGGAVGTFITGHYANLTRMATSPTLTVSPLRKAVGSLMNWPFTAVPLVDPRSSTNRFCPMRLNRACLPET